MDISGTNIHAPIYAMKKANEMPTLMLDLIQDIPNPQSQSLGSESHVTQKPADIATITGKGRLIDIIA